MCGILGYYNISEELNEKVGRIINYRGPDDYGEMKYNGFSLAHWRLSIIDLAKGQQPIYNEDKSIAVICNGEIYNFKELRKELSNHQFYTDTDTEVIVHAYEQYGEDFVKKLEGMLALAILDKNMILCFWPATTSASNHFTTITTMDLSWLRN